jgi:hypothetical protein
MATGSTQIGKREGACASGPRWRRTHQAPTHTPFQKSAPASGPPLCCCSRTQSKTNCARKESAGVCHSRLGRGRGESSTHRAMACLHSLVEGAATSSWILAPPATLLCPEQGMGAWQPTAPACLTLNSTFWSSGVAFLGAGGLGGEATAEWPMVERRHTRWPESLQHDRSLRDQARGSCLVPPSAAALVVGSCVAAAASGAAAIPPPARRARRRVAPPASWGTHHHVLPNSSRTRGLPSTEALSLMCMSM